MALNWIFAIGGSYFDGEEEIWIETQDYFETKSFSYNFEDNDISTEDVPMHPCT